MGLLTRRKLGRDKHGTAREREEYSSQVETATSETGKKQRKKNKKQQNTHTHTSISGISSRNRMNLGRHKLPLSI